MELVPGNGLITPTPQAGHELAMKLAQLTVKATQPNPQEREKLRGQYSGDAAELLAERPTWWPSSSPPSPPRTTTGAEPVGSEHAGAHALNNSAGDSRVRSAQRSAHRTPCLKHSPM